MNIGKAIKKIRTENGMSQEDFSQIFYVTRQTVSNWENGKSYPDLNTIVKISDRFGVSLDRLLREDLDMINDISEKTASGIKWNRLRRTVFTVISVIVIFLLITLTVYGIIWISRKNSLEKNFSQNVYSLGFAESPERYYILQQNDETYVLPHQEMPSFWDFSTDFHAKYLDCRFSTEQYDFNIRISGDMYSLDITDNTSQQIYYLRLDSSGNITPAPAYDSDLPGFKEKYSAEISQVLQNGIYIYNTAYGKRTV
ncbi:MAG: helix-turn-helix domain-containing protein [Ruminococcus sp.]|nr:helix-turn-helix domain-containing protein [Ruminococcus sp.]